MKDLACRLLFGEAEGDKMHQLVERTIGGPCPCFGGGICPMLDGDNRSPLMAPGDEAVRRQLPLVPPQRKRAS